MPGDDDALDLVGPLVELCRLGVAVEAVQARLRTAAAARPARARASLATLMAVSVAMSLAMAATALNGSPRSHRRAACHVRARAASICRRHVGQRELRALLDATASSPAVSAAMHVSSAARAIPIAWALIPMRPLSSANMAALKPSPSGPGGLPRGRGSRGRTARRSGEPCSPSLCSGAPALKPGVAGLDQEGADPLSALGAIGRRPSRCRDRRGRRW